MSISIFFAADAATAKTRSPKITIEAEYGSVVIEGSVYTAAHHQPEGSPFAGRHLPGLALTGRPSPCNDENIPTIYSGEILISHMDLDTLGGIMRALPLFERCFTSETQDFWDAAEFVDVNGVHKFDPNHAQHVTLASVWAYLQANRIPLGRGVSGEVTNHVENLCDQVSQIVLWGAREEEGKKFIEDGKALNEASFVSEKRGVIVRKSDGFTNHLYRTASGELCEAVVALNTKFGSITISLADPIEGIVCRDVVQELWGMEAGGHAGIAGSPRGWDVDLEVELAKAIEAMDKLIVRRNRRQLLKEMGTEIPEHLAIK